MSSLSLLTEWVDSASAVDFFYPLLEVCSEHALYIVNAQQQIVYWSKGAESLTGLPCAAQLGQKCSADYAITSTQSRVLQLTSPQGQPFSVTQQTRLLVSGAGQVLGGLALLEPSSECANIVQTTAKQENFHGMLSRSPAMRAVFTIIENAAETEATVLVRGESGSGKELAARAIHNLSARRDQPFLAINCAALSSNLLDSELFGHVRGAFTGAIKDHAGLFQRAQGGTLFLDEVAELPLDLQAKLLRVVQERNYIPVGGSKSIEVDVRLVAATHRSLREQVKQGLFREDLMYRLRVVPIFLPPLRERREDISLLLWHFIQLHNGAKMRKIEKIEPAAMRVLLDYAWPGNIRELHNVIEYAFAVGRGSVLRCCELPPEFREARVVSATPAHVLVRNASPQQEASAISHALEQHKGNINTAAQSLGMSRATFWRKRKAYGL